MCDHEHSTTLDQAVAGRLVLDERRMPLRYVVTRVSSTLFRSLVLLFGIFFFRLALTTDRQIHQRMQMQMRVPCFFPAFGSVKPPRLGARAT